MRSIALLFGNFGGALAWVGQVLASHWGFGLHCGGQDSPLPTHIYALPATLLFVNCAAIFVAVAGTVVSFLCWQLLSDAARDISFSATIAESRLRLMAVWGTLSSLWFLGAIAFNVQSPLVRGC